MVTLGTVDHWDVIGQKGILRQAEVVTAGSMVSEAVVRQAGNRDHTGTGMFTVAQSVGQWVTGTVGSVEPCWIILVRGAPLSQASHCHHTRPKGQGNHSGRDVSEGHTGTGMVSGGHTGSRISGVTPRAVSRQTAVLEAAPLTVSLAAQRRESAVKEMQPESASPKPLSTRW